MIDVGKFAKPLITTSSKIAEKSFFHFGTDEPANLAIQLRMFADKVESSDILIQKVQAGQVASIDQYFMQAIFIEFAEKETVEKVIVPGIEEAKAEVAALDLPPDTSITITVPSTWTPQQISILQGHFSRELARNRVEVWVCTDQVTNRRGLR